MPLTGRSPLVELRKLHIEHGGLERIEPAVEAHKVMVITRLLTMIAEHSQLCREFGIVCRDQSAITESTQVLGWVKAKASGQAHRAGPSAFVFRADRLARVLDNRN